MILIIRRQKAQNQKRRYDYGRRGQSDEGLWAKECGQLLEAGKAGKQNLPLGIQKEHSPTATLTIV